MGRERRRLDRVAALGGLAAVARFALDAVFSDRAAGPFPTGILVVNLSGTFVLGVAAGAGLGGEALVIVAGGITGSFTTFSTWMWTPSGSPARVAAGSRSYIVMLAAAWRPGLAESSR